MERETCIRCGGEMIHIGQERLQKGEAGVLLGLWGNIFAGALKVDIYCCKKCKKLEFYAIEPPEEEDCEEGSMAKEPCPYCGVLHELDDAVCPHCGKRLMG